MLLSCFKHNASAIYALVRRKVWDIDNEDFDLYHQIDDIEMELDDIAQFIDYDFFDYTIRIERSKNLHPNPGLYFQILDDGERFYKELRTIEAIDYVQKKFDYKKPESFFNKFLSDFGITFCFDDLTYYEFRDIAKKIPQNHSFIEEIEQHSLKLYYGINWTHYIELWTSYVIITIYCKRKKCWTTFVKPKKDITGNFLSAKKSKSKKKIKKKKKIKNKFDEKFPWVFTCKGCGKIIRIEHNLKSAVTKRKTRRYFKPPELEMGDLMGDSIVLKESVDENQDFSEQYLDIDFEPSEVKEANEIVKAKLPKFAELAQFKAIQKALKRKRSFVRKSKIKSDIKASFAGYFAKYLKSKMNKEVFSTEVSIIIKENLESIVKEANEKLNTRIKNGKNNPMQTEDDKRIFSDINQYLRNIEPEIRSELMHRI